MSMSGATPRRSGNEWRALDGVLLLDKPAGITSHTAVQRARRMYSAAKAGHTGTLDPLATGLLPVCLGEATKFSHLLLEATKSYLATIRLGITTTTGDLEGEVTARAPVAVGKGDVEKVLPRFTGEILQTPPMYSAIKHNGQPLYKLARAGKELARVPRRVVVSDLKMCGMEGNEIEISLTCSKGTYVRVLAEDIGRSLGCGACLSRLRRTAVGDFSLSAGAVTFEQLEPLTLKDREALLLPADALVAALPRVDLDAGEAGRLKRGQQVEVGHAAVRPTGLARIYGPDHEFLGVAEVTAPGRIVPRRLKSQATVV